MKPWTLAARAQSKAKGYSEKPFAHGDAIDVPVDVLVIDAPGRAIRVV